MTSLVIARRRLALRFTQLRVEAIFFAVVMLAGLAIGLVGFLAPAGAADDIVSVQLTPAKAAALVAATSASPGEDSAVGEEAQLINAALPFSTAPVQAARPFDIAGAAAAHRRGPGWYLPRAAGYCTECFDLAGRAPSP